MVDVGCAGGFGPWRGDLVVDVVGVVGRGAVQHEADK